MADTVVVVIVRTGPLVGKTPAESIDDNPKREDQHLSLGPSGPLVYRRGVILAEIAACCSADLESHPHSLAAVVMSAARDRTDIDRSVANVPSQHFRTSLESAAGKHDRAGKEVDASVVPCRSSQPDDRSIVILDELTAGCLVKKSDSAFVRRVGERFEQSGTATARDNHWRIVAAGDLGQIGRNESNAERLEPADGRHSLARESCQV